MKLPDYDPPESEREWMRHTVTGERGYMVRRDGESKVRYDRGPKVEQIVKYRPSEWVEDAPPAVMSLLQASKVAFEADKALCALIGLYRQSKQNWLDLHEDDRITWMKEGPESPPLRVELYQSIMSVLRKIAE